ncbi:MAG: adenosylcobinamide-GDP ribazoletransferase [Clostridia bacterium]|jgi:adenosylcobinamide-GDP ribazoletransferase|nr:adenosylcobinamide-GDP ribazoletransferase [Clostridia bacterium]
MTNFLIALQFLTRIPIGEIQFNEKNNFINSVKFYPLVGLLIGILLVGCYSLLNYFLPSLVLAVVILIISILITGGLHLDGLMDTVDGLMSARDKDRMLEIMKDSRVGAHSVWAVICLLLMKFALLASLSLPNVLISLLLMPVIARWQVLLSMSFWPYAREKGLGKLFLAKGHRHSFIVNGLAIFLLVFWLTGLLGLIAVVGNLVIVWLFNNVLTRKLDGLTGDTYGAVIELSEVLMLFLFLLLLG